LKHFLGGPENQLLQQVSAAVTSDWGRFNPLFIFGPSGTGKTHLVHCLVATAEQQYPRLNHLYFTGADYARVIHHAIDVDSIRELRVKHRQSDLLIIDGVHELAGKSAAQEELLQTTDHLSQNGSVLICTAHQELDHLSKMSPTLVSRLSGGLVIPLARPGNETQREILATLANAYGMRLPDEVHQQLYDSAHLCNSAPTVAQLRSAVLELRALPEHAAALQTTKTPPASAKAILRAVAKYFHVTAADLRGNSRRKTVTSARAMATYLLRSRHGSSFQKIGQLLGGRDHTTILHAFRRAEHLLETDTSFHRTLNHLLSVLD